MARINIDDDFWLSLLPFATAIGDLDKAIGQAIRFIKLSQERFKQSKIITDEEFNAQFHNALIGTFAERLKDGGVQAIGAEEYFGWLRKRKDAASRGGKSKFTNATAVENLEAAASPCDYDTLDASKHEANASKGCQTQASSSSSSSFSKKKLNTSNLEAFETRCVSQPTAFEYKFREAEIQNFVNKVSQKKLEALSIVYGHGQVLEEIRKAFAWCAINPKKAPRTDVARFLGSWIARAKDMNKKALPGRTLEARGGSYSPAQTRKMHPETLKLVEQGILDADGNILQREEMPWETLNRQYEEAERKEKHEPKL
jgi:hypothetical protein